MAARFDTDPGSNSAWAESGEFLNSDLPAGGFTSKLSDVQLSHQEL